jgi:two-component system sensor histidine kinase YesM
VNLLRDINRLSFRNKLKTAFLAVTILSILITGGFSYVITANILENNAMKLTQDTVEKSAEIVDEKLNKLMLVMMTLMISDPFKSMLKDVAAGKSSQYFAHMANLENVFSQARMTEPLIHSIYVSTPMGEFYPLTMNRNRQSSFFESPLYERILLEQKNVWIEGHEDKLFLGNNRVISLILEPISEDYVKDVYIVVNIREDGLRRLVGLESEGGSSRFLLNGAAQLVGLETDPLVKQVVNSGLMRTVIQKGPTGYDSYKLGNETYLLNYARLGITDWTIMAVQSKDHVLKDLIYVTWMIVFITAGALIVTGLVSGAFTRYLLKPLYGLQEVMKRVEGNDLKARFVSRNEDELAQVGFRFNQTLDQIVVLIEEIKLAETNKRVAEIKALSAQMDPHFLYNTLNTIYWKLKLKQVDQSQKMVVSLSRLFQLGLNKGHEITTLDKELEHVRQYLELQTYCYEHLFEYDIQVKQPWLLGLPLPRIMLQPLVENSILHGFRSMESGGRISIEIDGDIGKEPWIIRVRDNGLGMDEATVRSLSGHEQDDGYAIRNLVSRLQLYYGDKANITIDSVLGQGVLVTLSMPLKGDHLDVQP